MHVQQVNAQCRKPAQQQQALPGKLTACFCAVSSANRSALSWLLKDFVCTRKSRNSPLNAEYSWRCNMPDTQACKRVNIRSDCAMCQSLQCGVTHMVRGLQNKTACFMRSLEAASDQQSDV